MSVVAREVRVRAGVSVREHLVAIQRLRGRVDPVLLHLVEPVRRALAPAGPEFRVVGPVHQADLAGAGAAASQRLATMNITFPSSDNLPRPSRG